MTTGRRRAREAVLQVLYSCEIAGTAPDSALEAYFVEHWPEASEVDRAFVAHAVRGTVSDRDAVDALIAQHSLRWRPERMAAIDKLILRQAIWELRHMAETPPAVVLNESLELARRFSSEESVRFVNGVLDAVRATVEASRRT